MSEDLAKAMYKDYLSNMTLSEVATKYGLKSNSSVLYHFQRNNLGTRKRGGAIKQSQKGSENGNWKGGRVTGKKGYVRLWTPDHQRADKDGYVYEHIIMGENKIGRELRDNEVIHHINGNKSDNRYENLLVCTQSEHIKIHLKEITRGRINAK